MGMLCLFSGWAQAPAECQQQIQLTSSSPSEVLIFPEEVNCFSCDLPGGSIEWFLEGTAIFTTAQTFGSGAMALTSNGYLIVRNPQLFVTPGRAGRQDILCRDALANEIERSLLSPCECLISVKIKF